jgi:5-methylcytosine-specific restriction enzyme A
MATTNAEWSDEELAAAAEAYLQMLELQKRNQPYNKAEINEALRASGRPLAKRSRPSIEYRMRNISTVLRDEGLQIVKGYTPAENVGSNVHDRISRILKKLRDKSCDEST